MIVKSVIIVVLRRWLWERTHDSLNIQPHREGGRRTPGDQRGHEHPDAGFNHPDRIRRRAPWANLASPMAKMQPSDGALSWALTNGRF